MKSILTVIGVFLLCGSASACSYCGQPAWLAMPSAHQMPWAVAIIAGMFLTPVVLFFQGYRIRKAEPMRGGKCVMLAIGMVVGWMLINTVPSFGSTLANLLMLPPLIVLLTLMDFGLIAALLALIAALLYCLLFCIWLGRYHVVKTGEDAGEQ